MARKRTGSPTSIARAGFWLGVALTLALGSGAGAQERAARPREVLKTAIDHYKKGDYENAARYFAQAQVKQAELAEPEKQDLATFASRNGLALKGRQEGAALLRQADESLKQGRPAEAEAMVKLLNANQYLTPADRQTLAGLNVKLRPTGPGDAGSADAKGLLDAARQALQQGKLDEADALAVRAEKVASSFAWLQPWADSPSKVRRDVQAARAKAAPPPPPAPAPAETAENKESSWSLAGVRNLFSGGKAEAPKQPAKEAPASNQLPERRVDFASRQPSNRPDTTATTAKYTAPATPEKKAGPSPMQQVGAPPAPTAPAKDKNVLARQLLYQGFKAMEANDLETARKLAFQVRDLRVEFGREELGPDQLLSEIQRRVVLAQRANGTPADSRALVRESRNLLQQNRLEEAEKLCNQAASIQGVRWGLFEDTPEKVRRDLLKVRARRDREESSRLLIEARKLFAAGNNHEAKVRAWRSQQLHGPYSPFDFGDRPQRLLDEIHRAEVRQKRDSLPGGETQVAANKPPAAPAVPPKVEPVRPAPLVSAAAQSAAKNRAIVLLREARDLERQGRLLDAWHKTGEAKKLNAPFALGEESPDALLQALAAKGKRQIQATVQQVTDGISRGTDPARFAKAREQLDGARRLAQTFGLDTFEIDQKGTWLQQVASNSGVSLMGGPQAPTANPLVTASHSAPPGAPTPPAPTPAPAPSPERLAGLEKLDKARLELRAGNTSVARRLAEDAYNPAFGVQQEAGAVLASIDAEEHNQRVLAADRAFEAGLEAFSRKDYRRATGIFAEVNLKLLAPERQSRLREIMGTREMQPVVQAQHLEPTKDGTLTKPAGTAVASDKGDDPIDHAKAMEKIQFEQMYQRGLQAQRGALDLFKAGQEMKAMELLNAHLAQVEEAQFGPDYARQLRGHVEKRLQEFRTLQAQKLLDKQRQGLDVGMKYDEGERVRKERKYQEQVADVMKQYQALRKEGKFKEALAAAYRAKELDPDNVAASAAIQMTEFTINQQEYDRSKKQNADLFRVALDQGVGPLPTDEEPFKLSDAAKERIKKRPKDINIWSQTRNPAERAIEYRLSQPITFSFKDRKLGEAIDDLNALSGIPVYAETRALQEAGIGLDQPMSLQVENMAMKSALNILLNKAKLTYVIKDDALMITTEDQAKGKLRQVVYPVTDLVVPVENHPIPDVYNLQAVLQRHINSQQSLLSHGNATPVTGPMGLPNALPVSSMASGLGGAFAANAPSLSGQVASAAPPQPRRPGQTMEDILQSLITNTVHPATWKEKGGPGTIQYYPLGMALIINQTQEVQGDIADLLAALRRLQDMEVAIEMRLVSVSEAFYERIGLDFDVNLRTPVNAGVENQLLNSSFAPAGLVNRNLNFDRAVFGMTPAGTLTPDLNVPIKNSSFGFSVPPFGGYTAPGVDGGLSLGLAFLSDIQVFMLLEAAQGDRRTNIMQAPKITVFNGQTAFINVNVNQFVNLGITAVPVSGQIVFAPNNTPLPIGVSMQVTPVVSADRRFVRLNLQPSLSNLIDNLIPVFPVQIPIPNLVEGPGVGATPVGQPVIFNTFLIQQPAISTITIDTTVNVPDGGTVLLGGLKTMAEGRNEAGPPILSKIPYLSRLFRNVGYGREGQSLMIMVTPRIIINEEEERIFMGELEPIPRQ